MRTLILAALLAAAPSLALAADYDIVCTAPCKAVDGSTQPAGTVLNIIVWDGVTPYTPADDAGNTGDVTLALDVAGTAQVYTPPAPPQ